MADEADHANEYAERMLASQIAEARTAPPALPSCGACLWCGDPVNEAKRFCSAECREDWDSRSRANQRNGKNS